MKKAFMDNDFLLETETAKLLYHEYAEKMPIIDYHCHLEPLEIYENRRFNNLSEIWLGGDHYKWRLMRANGISEECITGNAAGFEKFKAYAEVLPRAIGNPIYHWSHMELRRYFGCNDVLCPETANDVWEYCNNKLKNEDDLRVRGILENSGVKALITTDDPIDDLHWHKKIAKDDSFKIKVLPCWRLGTVLEITNPDFMGYINKLEEVTDISVNTYDDLKSALNKRMEYFMMNGCRVSDHGVLKLIYAPTSDEQLNQIFNKAQRGEAISDFEAAQYKFGLLCFCAKEYARLGWAMQFRLGPLRDVNSVMLREVGSNTGFDCIDYTGGVSGLANFLDTLESTGLLPKTILFSIDPNDNMAITTLAACFTEAGVRSKVQQGSAWWFNDTFYGMEQQLITFAEQGLLGNFLGMLTDSRSFLSYTRHEYFRRILCNLIGRWVDSGKYPDDPGILKSLVQDICYNNVKEYFGF